MRYKYTSLQTLGIRVGLLLRALWLGVLLLVGLAVSTVVAEVVSTDPDWGGSTPENVSNSSLDRAWIPDVAVDLSSEVVAVWSDEASEIGRDIYFASNAGGTWSAAQIVTNTTYDSLSPNVLAVGDQHFVAWVEPEADRIFESEIGSEVIRVVTSTTNLRQMQPCLAVSTDRLHLIFYAGDGNFYHTSRLLTEGAWPAAERAYTSTAYYGSADPALATGPDGSTLHLAWEDRRQDRLNVIRYMSGTVSGADVNWSPALTLSVGITKSILPDIAVALNGDVHVAWGEVGEGDYYEQYVRYVRYDAGTGIWNTPAVRIDPVHVQVMQASPTWIGPSIAVQEKNNEIKVCVAWHGFRADEKGPEEVLIRCSSDGGGTWSEVTQNVSRSSTDGGSEASILPVIEASGTGTLHVIWQEQVGSLDDCEVHYATSLQFVYLPLVLRDS